MSLISHIKMKLRTQHSVTDLKLTYLFFLVKLRLEIKWHFKNIFKGRATLSCSHVHELVITHNLLRQCGSQSVLNLMSMQSNDRDTDPSSHGSTGSQASSQLCSIRKWLLKIQFKDKTHMTDHEISDGKMDDKCATALKFSAGLKKGTLGFWWEGSEWCFWYELFKYNFPI